MSKKFGILLFIFLQISFCLSVNFCHAQNKLQANKNNIIKDSVGQIIINNKTSLLLFISTDSSGTNATAINKDEALKPLKQGKHQIVHFDNTKKSSKVFEFFSDSEAPRSKFNSDDYYILKKDTIIAPLNFELTFSAKDNISGINNIFVTLDDKSFQETPASIVFDKEKVYSLKFFASDLVGNVEDENIFILIIDNTPPTTTLNITRDQHENIVSKRSEFELIATDKHGIEEIKYSLNNNDFVKYNKAIAISNLNEGSHKLRYFAMDKLGNIEDTITYDFYIDKTPPMIFEEIAGNKFIRDGREYSSGRSQLKITAIDNKAGVKDIYYSFDNKDYTLYEGPVFLSMVSGNISISSYALDNVNNKSFSSASGTSVAVPYVDLNAPKISHKLKGPNIKLRDTLFVSPNTKIQINANDDESGLNRIIYAITGNKESEYNSPVSINEKGYFSFYYSAFDNVDNANTDEFSAFVDSYGPEINIDFSIKSYETHKVDTKELSVFPEHTKIFLSAIDNETGTEIIKYSLNNMKEQIYKGEISNFIKSEANILKVTAIDIMGNESKKEILFFIK